MKTSYIILFIILLFSNVICSKYELDSDSEQQEQEQEQVTVPNQPPSTCQCVPMFKSANYDEYTGFYYVMGISTIDGLRCGHIVTRNVEDGVKTFLQVSEFMGNKILEKGALYRIAEGRHFTIINVTLFVNQSSYLTTVLDADYDRDNGYILFFICELPRQMNQYMLLITRQPVIPDGISKRFNFFSTIKKSKHSESDGDSSDSNDQVDLPDFINNIKLYEVIHDKQCKYISDIGYQLNF